MHASSVFDARAIDGLGWLLDGRVSEKPVLADDVTIQVAALHGVNNLMTGHGLTAGFPAHFLPLARSFSRCCLVKSFMCRPFDCFRDGVHAAIIRMALRSRPRRRPCPGARAAAVMILLPMIDGARLRFDRALPVNPQPLSLAWPWAATSPGR